ncbi:uncharacterized protein F4807DRAFT_458157 [Annulohypoxylon truncatum]|uniref:uncharacterized protein n=1 Tax=Annulohypoxylon truncatum TaxID=327061 RepID=UPI002007CF82|nr:uncharacterized protein F4807DRAFT_458157 [Annulohypoxylon truncatum]KAI1211952.1 hypothetical protein F4807DRAFT_458157 [Annulohypoxylon truncatum]
MASDSSSNVGTPDRANKKADAGTIESPLRETVTARESNSGTAFTTIPPNRDNALAEVSGNVARSSSVNVPTTPTPAAARSGAMRTQRRQGRQGRHNPLARPVPKKKNTKKQDNENAAPPAATKDHDRHSDSDYDDSLDGVEADVDDLVGPHSPDGAANFWESQIPGLLEQVKTIACGANSVRGIHDDSEEGLRFMARGLDLE